MLTNDHHKGTRRGPRVVSWLMALMFVVSLTPAATAVMAAPANQAAPEAAAAQAGSFLEVHVSECEPGETGTPQELRDRCHDNGLAGVQMDVSSIDPALGINQVDKTTTRINDAGPGIINTGEIPAGDYNVAVDLPTEGNSFVVGCEVFESDQVHPVTPGDEKDFQVTIPQGVDIVCNLFVIPTADGQQAPDSLATLDFTVQWCDRGDLDGDDRSFDQLSANCTDLAAPPTAPETPISLMIGMPGGVTNQLPVDDDGHVIFRDLPDGDYPVTTNIDLNEAGQYLFCEYEGQERYEKDFDGNTTQFTNLLGEYIECDLFVVFAQPQGDAPEPTATTAPLQPQQVADDELTINITANTCPQDYDVAANGEDGATFAANCAEPVSNVMFSVVDSNDGQTDRATGADGTVAFPGLAPDTYRAWSHVPLEAATEYVFCTPADGVETPVPLSDRGVATLDNASGEIDCIWYIVPENLRGDETGATVTVHLATCPTEYAGDQFYADCHGNGVADMEFTLSGPNGEVTATTEIPADPGPGVATFTQLPPGDYTLAGGPPQDFGSVVLYCSDPTTNERIDAPMDGGIASFSLAEQQSILCDWYFIGDDARGEETPVPQNAEILVTLFSCDPALETAGATFAQLDAECTTTIDDVTFSLGAPGGTPITAATGVSGDGAVRFYDLVPSDYVMTPKLPADLTNTAVFCDINRGDVYQKPIQNGSTTFVNVEGEQIHCSWFVTPVQPEPPQEPAGPTGSITIRELLCEKERGSIEDWDRECAPGASGTAFSLVSSDGSITRNATPNDQGVLVFAELPDGYYELTQDTGVWCKAAAERVDSRSRVIVGDGANTNVFLYQCGQVERLPDTGTGPSDPATMMQDASLLLAALAVPAFAAALWHSRRLRPEAVAVEIREPERRPEKDTPGRMRFR